jgi:chromosome partitioning protein
VISRKINKTNLGKEIREALYEYGLPIFESGTTQRVIYAETAAEGGTVLDAEPNSDATIEITNIATELKEFTNNKVKPKSETSKEFAV